MNQSDRDMITSIISEITKSNIVNKEKYFEEKYPHFKDKYPHLLRTVCEGKIDKNNIHFMLSMLNKMENNNMSQYDASVEVGTMLFKKYVEPKINLGNGESKAS